MPGNRSSPAAANPDHGREPALLARDPPPWIVRGSAWLIIALFGVGILAAVFLKTPETITCPCVLVPEGGADPIQSPRLAVVGDVRAKEGADVAAGDVLFVLNSEEVGDRDTQLRTLEEETRSEQYSLRQADAASEAELKIQDDEIAQAEEELKFRESTVKVERDLVSRFEKLATLGVYSQTDLIVRKLDLQEAEKDALVGERTRQQGVLQREQMASRRDQVHAEKLAELNKLTIQLDALKGQLVNSSQSLVSVRAPYDAVVVSLAVNNPGSVVQSGQELCQLAHRTGGMRARLALAEPGLARLAVGQRVRFFADAFPYQRYGVIDGTLSWISPSAVSSRDGAQFVALATLDKTAVEANGQSRPLRVGMRGVARIAVGSRTLIEFVLEPLHQLRENLNPKAY